MQKLRIILQFNAGDDDRPRWLMLHSTVITEDTTPEILADTLESLEHRVNHQMRWEPEE